MIFTNRAVVFSQFDGFPCRCINVPPVYTFENLNKDSI